ncbi:spore germination protein gerkb [hydrocarbon metagenome]|uniref:Spore germination protein gerkb n=1 Tax=hydrocarbon metagenome TaxID=938273 RepID=A0A0W8E7J3_9ZZZZ
MSENQIASRQVAFLTFALIIGSAIIYMPESIAGRDAWLSTLLAVPVGLYILFVIITVQLMFPGMNMLDISELVLGRFAGRTLNAFYVWLLLIMSIFYLYDLFVFLDIVIFDLKRYVHYGIFILLAAYCIYKGINAVARLVELLVWVIVLFLLLGIFIATICCSQFSHLLPVLADWRPVMAGSLYAANWPFAQVSMLIIYFPYVSDLADKRRTIYTWYLMGALILIIRSVLIISILGVEITRFSRHPVYQALRLLQVGTFERIDLTFFALLFLSGFFALLVCYQSLVMGLQKLMDRDENRYLILPVGLLLVVLTSYMLTADVEVFPLQVQVLPFHTLPIHILYPSIILIAGKIYQKRKATTKTAAR